MIIDKQRLKQVIREEILEAVEKLQQSPTPGAGDARKSTAQLAVKKVEQLANKHILELAKKGDDVAKAEFLSIMARKLGISFKQAYALILRTEKAQMKAQAGE